MSAARADRQHVLAVELAVESQAQLDRIDALDSQEDDVIRRAHVAIHRFEQIDRVGDEARGELRGSLRELAGLLDNTQMRLGEVA